MKATHSIFSLELFVVGSFIYGRDITDENFINKHTEHGILSMANANPGTNGSQFFLYFVETFHFDRAHVVFGQVFCGLEVLDAIKNNPVVINDKPKKPSLIADCGQLE